MKTPYGTEHQVGLRFGQSKQTCSTERPCCQVQVTEGCNISQQGQDRGWILVDRLGHSIRPENPAREPQAEPLMTG